MAHKKGVGSTDNGRDSKSKRLGVKLFGGQAAKAGNIIIRQRGTKFHAGENVYMGNDHTLHAKIDGKVLFTKKRLGRTYVSILGYDDVAVATATPATNPQAAVSTPAVSTATVSPAKGEKIELPSGKKIVQDDLKAIEGIGPKIESLLHEAGITTWQALADAPVEQVQEILNEAGPRFNIHNPATWAKQAALAVSRAWEAFEKLQDELDGGREVE